MRAGGGESVHRGRGDVIVSVDHSVSVGGGPIEPKGCVGVAHGGCGRLDGVSPCTAETSSRAEA